ncbi:MAG: PaaI family thioesterase, partial [Bacteroidales bacterium]
MMKREIRNVFAKEDYYCFACSPHNPIGLQLKFYENGDYVEATWNPKQFYEGYPGVIHGGIQATLLDEIAAWVVYIKAKTSGVTSRISMKYRKPVDSKQDKITVKAKLRETKKNICYIEAQLINEMDEVCAEAEVIYFTFPVQKSIEMGCYPENYNSFF